MHDIMPHTRNRNLQEAQLSQRDRAMLHVIEYFAKSLEVIRNNIREKTVSPYLDATMYVEPFVRYSVLNNGVTLKSGFQVVQGHCIWRRSIDHIRLSIGVPL